MSSDDFVIRVEGLGKAYQVYASPRARLLQFFVPRLRRWLGLAPRSFYREFHALRGVSFQVRRGETVGVIGRNGSGKSTLLQLVCGTLSPSAGEVEVRGRVAALLELGSGFNPDFTGRENVHLYAALLGLSQRQIRERFSAIEDFAAIGEFIDQPIKTYSSGMVVRLAFAVAIHVDPDILVVDEALAVGDTAFQQKCLQRIRKMQAAGVAILLVTHSSNTLVEYCDRGIYLRRGELVMDGICRDVVKAYSDDVLAEEGAIGVSGSTLEPGSGATEPEAIVPPKQDDAAIMVIESVRFLDDAGKEVAAVASGAELTIAMDVRTSREVLDPCFGVQLASVEGITLWSAVTAYMGLAVGTLAPGRHRFRWRLRANFSGNRYVVALGAGHLVNGEYRRIHRLDYAGHFDVLPVARSGSGWLAPLPAFESDGAAVQEVSG